MSSPDGSSIQPDWELRAKYAAGECTPEEVSLVERWLAAHPLEAAALDAVDQGVRGSYELPLTVVDVEGALGLVHARMQAQGSGSAPVRSLRLVDGGAPRTARAKRFLYPAIGLAAAAGIATLMITAREAPDAGTGPAVAAAATREYRTTAGRQDTVSLQDGTRVVLGPDSRLIVAAGYGAGARDVELRGVGLFLVKHDAAAPFAVRANHAIIRDIGTAFTVRTAGTGGGSGDSTVAVAVLEGEVSIAASTREAAATNMLAGDRGEIRADGIARVNRNALTDADTAWKRGALAFRGAAMHEVQGDLARWYGVELRVEGPSLRAATLTGTFERQGVDQLLRSISLALGAQLILKDSVAILRSASTP